MKLDLPKFQRWACGNLVENRNRLTAPVKWCDLKNAVDNAG